MNNMLIHTSNIINWKSIKNNPQMTSTDEVLQCSIQVIKCCLKSENLFASNRIADLEVECVNHKDVINDERTDLRINAKLFLMSLNYQEIQNHMIQIFRYLDFKDLDTLILSFPIDTKQSSICMKYVYEVWSKLEQYVKDNRILQLGVCDFTLEQLEDLWTNVEVKPSINHINSRKICNVSQPLKDFAADNHIQLLSHHDSSDILPGDTFKSMLQDVVPNLIIESIKPLWTCRYSIVYKNRNVIRSRGYISKISWN